MNNLVEMLEIAASEQGASGFVFISDDGRTEHFFSYAEIAKKAKAIAAYLVQEKNLSVGDRALVVYPPGIDFVVAYFGCLYAGVVAVPVIPPIEERTADKLKLIVDDT